MVSSKVDGRHARSIFAQSDDNSVRIEPTTETALAGAETPNKGLTEPLGGSAVDQSTSRKDIARDYLCRAQESFARAARTRVSNVMLARQHGLTNAEIGELIGVSESAVRKLVKRHGDA